MNNTKTIYTPLFTGFYNTIHEFDNEYIENDFREEIENNKDSYYFLKLSDKEKSLDFNKMSNCDLFDKYFDKYFDIDYKEYILDYSQEYIESFKNHFEEGLKEIGFTNIEYKGLYSPEYYNYGNDEININISYNIKKLKKFLISNKNAFSVYIKKANTSCDGFIAFGDNDFDQYLSKADFEEFELTQIIEFYIETLDLMDIETDLYYETSENMILSEYVKEI